MIGTIIRALGGRPRPPAPTGQEPTLRIGGSVYLRVVEGARVPAALPSREALDADEAARSYRSDAALAMVDPEVYGFVLLLLRDDPEKGAEVTFRAQVEPEWVPAMHGAYAQFIRSAP